MTMPLQKPNSNANSKILYVDVCIRCNPYPELIPRVQDWLLKRYAEGLDGEAISFPTNETLTSEHCLQDEISLIHISGDFDGQQFVSPTSCNIEVYLYKLFPQNSSHTLGEILGSRDGEASNSPSDARVMYLPNSTLENSWQHLVFEPRIQDNILTGLIRLLNMRHSLSNCPNRPSNSLNTSIFLFWGPPGSGKSSLCKALAQKLSIRLQAHYPRSRLIEIDSHSLYSKYFSESAKMVAATLDDIGRLLDNEPKSLLVVLIDEIESLAGSRHENLLGNEPKDAMRAVNALLAGLDRLRSRSNLVVLSTSNLVGALDSAFLDRVDFKWHIPSPCIRARYEIIRQRIYDLSKIGWIRMEDTEYNVEPLNIFPHGFENATRLDCLETLPEFNTMLLRHGHLDQHPATRLWEISKRSESISGRSLQRLPMLSLALCSNKCPCPIEEALDALSKAVEKEFASQSTYECEQIARSA